jgi:type II secretion system protein G
MSAARRKGFTLIELLIVIVVIAILALIVFPRLMGASRRAKDSALKVNLRTLRNAIAQYEADCGFVPTALTDLTGATTDATLPVTAYKGPYLKNEGAVIDSSGGIPVNPYADASAAIDVHWIYSSGDVIPAGLTGTDVDGKAYSSY